MMNRVGILTFHYSNNYGGVLQSYCLYKFLADRGCNVEVIDFLPKAYTNSIILKQKQNITEKFNAFREENIRLSQRVDEATMKSILNHYHTIIVGSDQIWNPSQRKRKEYFLDYGTAFTGNKISYAADSTVEEVDMKDKNKLTLNLDMFKWISVRNEHSYQFVKQLVNKEVQVVVDPTVLYDFQDEIFNEEHKEDYIFMYTLGREISGSHHAVIEKIREKYGALPVYVVPATDNKVIKYDYANRQIEDCGPVEWVKNIKGAKFVYTDSYHGALFAMKYNKPFLAYYTEPLRASRFVDLAKRYEIDKYIITSSNDIDSKGSLKDEIDYPRIQEIIKKEKIESMAFLEQIILLVNKKSI